MSDPQQQTDQPTTAAERREVEQQQKEQREKQRLSAIRTFEAGVLNLVVSTAQQNTALSWEDVSGALERATAAAKALGGKK